MTAVSVLPVSKKTIVYGYTPFYCHCDRCASLLTTTLLRRSHDAGKTVHATYPAFNEKFKNIFTRLNLKGHIVSSKLLYACGDIEGAPSRLCLSIRTRLTHHIFPLIYTHIFTTGHWGSVCAPLQVLLFSSFSLDSFLLAGWQALSVGLCEVRQRNCQSALTVTHASPVVCATGSIRPNACWSRSATGLRCWTLEPCSTNSCGLVRAPYRHLLALKSQKGAYWPSFLRARVCRAGAGLPAATVQ